jgi:thioredoxin reductase
MAETLVRDVAIVGGGPAGLGAAIALRDRGVGGVIVLERETEAGGTPRHCDHPPYGLREFGRLMTGPAYARRLVGQALAKGVDIRPRHGVVALAPGGVLTVATPDGPLIIAARRVVLATGARETPRSAALVSGERPLGVINTGALQACLHLEGLRPFTRPVIVGTELVALSALWTCVRHGIRPLAVIEAGERPTARWPLGLFPHLLGAPVHFRSAISQIIGAPRVSHVEVSGDDGRRRTIACDGVLFTGRFLPETALARAGALVLDAGGGGLGIDQFGRCSDPAYFGAGNVLGTIETAGWRHREGRAIGARVADDLEGRLPAPAPGLAVRAGPGVAWVTPQWLYPGSPPGALDKLQLRARWPRLGAPGLGLLTARQGDRVLWTARVSTRPERRLLIPLQQLALDPDAGDVEVSIGGIS